MILNTVTITGADDNTDIEKMIDISERYPFVEWGILFSNKRTGTPRFPSYEWVKKLHDKNVNIKLSAHLCGDYAMQILIEGSASSFYKMNPVADLPISMFTRMQVNGVGSFLYTRYDLIEKFIKWNRLNYIFQFNKKNEEFCNEIIKRGCKPHFLHDGSGGRGQLPLKWERPIKGCFTGYAGGLTPENISDELNDICDDMTSDTIWIDVETGVRTNDILDFDKVEAFLKICKTWM